MWREARTGRTREEEGGGQREGERTGTTKRQPVWAVPSFTCACSIFQPFSQSDVSSTMPPIRTFFLQPNRMLDEKAFVRDVRGLTRCVHPLLIVVSRGRYMCRIFWEAQEALDDFIAHARRGHSFDLEYVGCVVPAVPSAVGVGAEKAPSRERREKQRQPKKKEVGKHHHSQGKEWGPRPSWRPASVDVGCFQAPLALGRSGPCQLLVWSFLGLLQPSVGLGCAGCLLFWLLSPTQPFLALLVVMYVLFFSSLSFLVDGEHTPITTMTSVQTFSKVTGQG